MALFAAIMMLQGILFFFSFQKIYALNQAEREIAESIPSYGNDTIYTCAINGALASYKIKNPIVDLYASPIEHVSSNSLVLFNYNEFSQYFRDSNPMLNWKFLNDHYELVPVRSFPLGWQLYAINTSNQKKLP